MCHLPDIFPDWGKIITAGVDNVKLIDAAVQFFYKFRSAFFAPFRFQFIQVKGRITGKFQPAVSKENAFVISFQRGESCRKEEYPGSPVSVESQFPP